METKNRSEETCLAIVTGQKQWAGVGDGRKFRLTEHGLEFVGKMPVEHWQNLMLALKRVRGSWDMCLATAVRYGVNEYGLEVVQETLRQQEFDYQDAVRALSVAQLELDFSSFTGLTNEHYLVLSMAYPDSQEEQEKWARIALEEGMDALRLKRSIEEGRVMSADEIAKQSGRGSGGLGYLEGFGMLFHQWERRIGGKQKLLELDEESKRRWLESVRPVVSLAREVEDSLKEVGK